MRFARFLSRVIVAGSPVLAVIRVLVPILGGSAAYAAVGQSLSLAVGVFGALLAMAVANGAYRVWAPLDDVIVKPSLDVARQRGDWLDGFLKSREDEDEARVVRQYYSNARNAALIDARRAFAAGHAQEADIERVRNVESISEVQVVAARFHEIADAWEIAEKRWGRR